MGKFKINVANLHFTVVAKLSDDRILNYGFNSADDNENPDNYDIAFSYIVPIFGNNGLFGLIGMVGIANLFLAYKSPYIGLPTSALFMHQLNKLIMSSDGLSQLADEASENDDSLILANNALELSEDAELRLIEFINKEITNPHNYSIYEYNCATFAKEAFCTTYPDKCDDFKDMVMNQVYENPTFLNLISISFLNTFDML